MKARRGSAFIRALEAPGAADIPHALRWSNNDLDPTPAADRRWTKWDYMAVWWGTSFNANSWASASALISVGLGFGDAMAANVVASAITSVASVLNARQGALYHVGYPVLVRSQMGMYGAFFFVFLRAVVAIVWFGVQSYYTGRLFSVALRCVFGARWTDMPPFPASAGIASSDFVAFMLVYALQLPLMFVHPANIRRAFEVKALILPPVAAALTGWVCVRAGGAAAFAAAPATTVRGAALGWAWMNALNSVIATVSPMMLNQPDLARYATRPGEAGWWQGGAMFVVKNLVAFMSIATASALAVMYGGPAQWNLWDQLSLILDHNWTPAARCGVFVVAVVFAFATTLTNISANSIPFGADMTGVAPRWLTIRRGQVLVWALGLAIVPWKFLVSAAKFLTFLGSYTVLMGAVLGVVFCDFYVIRKGNVHIPSCYDGAPGSLYYFTRGINWRGCVAWLAGVAVPLPGLAGAYSPAAVSPAAVRMYDMGWLLSVSIAFSVHWVLNWISPVPVFPRTHAHMPVTREYLGAQTRSGVFDDEHWLGPRAAALAAAAAAAGLPLSSPPCTPCTPDTPGGAGAEEEKCIGVGVGKADDDASSATDVDDARKCEGDGGGGDGSAGRDGGRVVPVLEKV